MKIKLFTLALTLSLSLCAVYIVKRGRFAAGTRQTPEYGSLSWRIEQAKAKGERQLQISSIIDYASDVSR